LINRPKAFEIHSGLVKAKYAAAYDKLGWIYYYDKKNVAQAVITFRGGSDLGDPDSMVSLADMIDRGAYIPPNAPIVKMSLLKKAADLGDQAAVQIYNGEIAKQQPLQQRQLQEQEVQHGMGDILGTILRNMPRR
jgi:TPR repeat protein